MKPTVQFLSRDEIARVHEASLHILSKIGMKFPSTGVQDLLGEAGAEKGKGGLIKVPPGLVERAVASVPKWNEVVLYGRDPRYDVTFRNHEPKLACMTMATSVIDLHTREKRPATNDDLAKLTRVAHALPRVEVNGGLITPQDVPGAVNDWYTWATCLKNTTKHITGGVLGTRGVRDVIGMASVAFGSEDRFLKRPCISGWVLTLPPLGIDNDSLEALVELSRWKIPAMVSSGPILGVSSPVTVAGTVVQAHAEILGCLVVSQLTSPGAPFIYTSFARGMDMRTGSVTMASPEFAILKIAMAQMGSFLGLPTRMPGMLRDAKLLDAQAGFETGMVSAMTGLVADLMDGMQLDSDLVVDYADLIFCDDCMGAIKRLARFLDVRPETLAVEVIDEVGPGGTFLSHDHTVTRFREELWQPGLMERRNWDQWASSGARPIDQAALERVRTMVRTESEPLIPAAAAAEIDAIVERARRDLAR
jgi:trimethylamine---corrinoid protein Co-methyltransferase